MPAENTARKLQQAKQDLEAQLRLLINSYDQSLDEPLEFDYDVEADQVYDGDGNGGAHGALKMQVSSALDMFKSSGVVQQSGLYISRVTAIDSDGDGEAAINVKYEYPV